MSQSIRRVSREQGYRLKGRLAPNIHGKPGTNQHRVMNLIKIHTVVSGASAEQREWMIKSRREEGAESTQSTYTKIKSTLIK